MKFTIKKEDIQNRALASFWGEYQCLILIESVIFIALIGFGYYSFTNQFATLLWTVALVFVVCVGIHLGLRYNSLYHNMQSDFKRLSKDGILECELLREEEQFYLHMADEVIEFQVYNITRVLAISKFLVLPQNNMVPVVLSYDEQLYRSLKEREKKNELCYRSKGVLVWSWIFLGIVIFVLGIFLLAMVTTSQPEIFGIAGIFNKLEYIAIVMPFALACLFFYLKSKKLHNLICGAAVLFICMVAFLLTPLKDNYVYDSLEPQETLKASCGIELPEYVTAVYDKSKNTGYYYIRDMWQYSDFHHDYIDNSDLFKTTLDERFVHQVPPTHFKSEYYLVYNITKKEANIYPTEKGTYKFVLIGYSDALRAYTIVENITITIN